MAAADAETLLQADAAPGGGAMENNNERNNKSKKRKAKKMKKKNAKKKRSQQQQQEEEEEEASSASVVVVVDASPPAADADGYADADDGNDVVVAIETPPSSAASEADTDATKTTVSKNKKKRRRKRSDSNASGGGGGASIASSDADAEPAKSKAKANNDDEEEDEADDVDDCAAAAAAAAPIDNGFVTIRPPLSPAVLSFLSTPPYNFPIPTPVQSTTIPLFLTHRDVFVRAVTGSGKTLAFLIPVVEMILRRTTLLKGRQIGGLILEPTRELARQTYRVCEDLCAACGMNEPLLLVGGGGGGGGDKNNKVSAVSRDLQQFARKQSDIVVGTPGRVEDVLTRCDNVDVSELEVLILDESDVLLDMGFEITLTSILGRLPRMRRTGLFSATNSGGVRRLCAKSGMRNPVVVDVAINAVVRNDEAGKRESDGAPANNEAKKQHQQQATPSSLTNYYLVSPLDEKLSRLLAFLRQHSGEKVIVFFLTCACVEYYVAVLKKLQPPCKGYEYEALHGKLVQKRREKAMARFREGGSAAENDDDGEDGGGLSSAGRALLCTDVASRGLDVPDVSWTIQFDAPVDPSTYVHRVGRSARAGQIGNSLVFLTEKEESYVDFLRLRKVPLREMGVDEVCRPPLAEEEEEKEGGGDDDDDEMEEEEERVGKEGSEEDEGGGNESMELETSEDAVAVKSKPAAANASTTGKRIIRSAAGPDVVVTDVLPYIRRLVLKDRDILEKGTKAYTSYIRAYKEHHCGFIFRFASLDLGLLATSFSLLRLPKMPELRDRKLPNFAPAGPEIDIHGISFKDKIREAARQKRLAAELAAGGKNAKQIKAEQRAAERLRKQKEKRADEIAKGRNPNKKKKGRQQKIFDEWDDLAREERMYKKLRTNKISKEEYDREMYGEGEEKGGGDGSDDDDESD